MATLKSQPELLPLKEKCLTGFIRIFDETKYYLSVDYSRGVPIVELDQQLQAIFDQHPGKLKLIEENSTSTNEFVNNLVDFLEDVSTRPSTDKKHLLILIKQIVNLPAESIKSVDRNFKQITLQEVDESGRTHFLSLELHGEIPRIVCDLPEPLNLPLSELWSCQRILEQFKKMICQYQPLWNALDDIDGNSWVIEPELYSRNALHRRIVIKENVSIIVTLDAIQPTSLPRCTFLGSARAIQPLQNVLDEKGEEFWDPSQSVLENISDILQVELPQKPNDQNEKINIECGICYCYEMIDQIPDISCNNDSCRQLYHLGCLVEWFKGLPHVRQSFGTVFGECPYCSKPMHVHAIL